MLMGPLVVVKVDKVVVDLELDLNDSALTNMRRFEKVKWYFE